MSISLKTALSAATVQLQAVDTAAIDAELLLCKVLNCSRVYLYAYKEVILTTEQSNSYQQLLAKRQEGMPVAYLIGSKAWWSLNLKVTPATLIPRPETELLLECILKQYPNNKAQQVLELGTGSGAIAIALAQERPNWSIYACDISQEAIAIAKLNLPSNISNVAFFQSNWFSCVNYDRKFDIIVSNPPYLSNKDPHLTQGDLRFEPRTALISGNTGLEDLTHIIQQSPKYLTKNGQLLVEHGYDQKNALRQIFINNRYKNIRCWQDYADNDRVSAGCY